MRHLPSIVRAACTLLLTCTALFGTAQVRNLKGTVTDPAGLPIPSATVRLRSAANFTLTGRDGTFRIQAAAEDSLEVSAIGFQTYKVRVGTDTLFKITLQRVATDMQDIVLVGTRTAGRTRMETPLAVDVVDIPSASLSTARAELTSILNYSVPSLNFNRQSGSDGADHMDVATLRGLSPDQTLVLINSKRRHQTAFVAVFGTRGRGSTATDMSAIPTGAIERVEVLRDGASAQYGTDAMAGVINVVLRNTVGRFTGNVGWSGYLDDEFNPAFRKEWNEYVHAGKMDGRQFNFNGNYGFRLGKKGFLNLTGQFTGQEKTFRQVLTREEKDPGYLPLNTVRRAHGEGSLTGGGIFANMEVPMKDGSVVYAFGGINRKRSEAYAFTRNWSARPDRFPTNPSGGLVFVPGIMRASASGDTFFNPLIGTNILDVSLSAGIKGKARKDWVWDFGNTIGYNDFRYSGIGTFNASYGAGQTKFDDGGFRILQNTANASFTKFVKGVANGLNLSFGGETRQERYQLYPGEEASWRNYDPSGSKATGAQGFPGYQPSDKVKAIRDVVGVYGDAELDVTEKLLLNGALRYENYTDFGRTVNFKFAFRRRLKGNLNLRGSVNSGYRAPSLAQINFSSTFTTVQGGDIAEVRIVPSYLSLARKAGIPTLKQERSMNFSGGLTWKPLPGLNLSLDGYSISIADRVVLTGQFAADDPDLDATLAAELKSKNISLAQFFANAVDTRNAGVDLVADYTRNFGDRQFRAQFALNVQGMSITAVNIPDALAGSAFLRESFFNDRERSFLLASAPPVKGLMNLEYKRGRLTAGIRLTHFGKVKLAGYGEDGLGIAPQVPKDDGSGMVDDIYTYRAKTPLDLYLGVRLKSSLSLHIGADNLLNTHPDLGVAAGARGWAYNNETGGPWDSVQMGGNGRRVFTRLSFNF